MTLNRVMEGQPPPPKRIEDYIAKPPSPVNAPRISMALGRGDQVQSRLNALESLGKSGQKKNVVQHIIDALKKFAARKQVPKP